MQQSKPTTQTITKCNRLIDYAVTYPNAVIHYHASNMILHSDKNAAYRVLPKSRIRIAGHFYRIDHPPLTETPKPNLKVPTLTIFQILKM